MKVYFVYLFEIQIGIVKYFMKRFDFNAAGGYTTALQEIQISYR